MDMNVVLYNIELPGYFLEDDTSAKGIGMRESTKEFAVINLEILVHLLLT